MLGADRRGPGEQPLDAARVGLLRAALEVDQAPVEARSGSPATCSPRAAGAAGRGTGRPRRRRARPAATQATISAASASDSRAVRLRVADPHLDGAEREVRAHRPPDLRVLDDRVGRDRGARGSRGRPPSRRRRRGRRSAGSTCVKICVRAECRPVSRPSRNGEFALSGQQQRQHGRSRSQDAHGAVDVADADVDVQREGVVAPRDVLQPVDDAAVVLGVDVGLLAVVGPRVRAGRAERDAARGGEREQAPARLALAGERVGEVLAAPGADLDLARRSARRRSTRAAASSACAASRSSSKRGTSSSVSGSRIANSSSMPDRAVGRGREGRRRPGRGRPRAHRSRCDLGQVEVSA